MMNLKDWKRLEKDIINTMFIIAKFYPLRVNLNLIDEYQEIYKIYQAQGYKPNDLYVRWGKANDDKIVWVFDLPERVFEKVKEHYKTRLSNYEINKWYVPRFMEPVQKIILTSFIDSTGEFEQMILDK